MKSSRSIEIYIDGTRFDQWESAEVTRDLKNFAGTFQFQCRDNFRSQNTFLFSTDIPPIYRLKPSAKVQIYINKTPILYGFVETVSPSITSESAVVAISGKDMGGDLIDCAATESKLEFNKVKLEDAVKKIAEPYGLKVRTEVDTGAIFDRYSLDLAETGLSALEKGARQRGLLLLSDGIGGLVVTRSGANRAPAGLKLPGNVIASSGSFSHKNRFSKTIVHGQGEKNGGKRLDGTAVSFGEGKTKPLEERQQQEKMRTASNSNTTNSESAGVCALGEAQDKEVGRYRPKVHLAATKGNDQDCQNEAEWRTRTSRGAAEELRYTVYGHTVNGKIWRVNDLIYVSDSFQGIERDMLICGISFKENAQGKTTDLTIISPEAFGSGKIGEKRQNNKNKAKTSAENSNLDGTAEAF